MRKIAAILLLLLLVFNWYGYRFVIAALQQGADRRLETIIDNSEYDDSQLVEVKVALNMPYQQRFTSYERHYGQVEINGRSFTYVKRKVAGDTVYLQCLPNTSRQQLKAINNDWIKANAATENDHPGKQQPSSFAKNFWSEYDGQHSFDTNNVPATVLPVHFFTHAYHLPRVSLNSPFQPPEC